MKIDGDTLEAMAIDPSTDMMYVNNPAKNEVIVLNRKTRSVLASWPVKLGKHNVAMALNDAGYRLFVASRSGDISIFDTSTGKEVVIVPHRQGC